MDNGVNDFMIFKGVYNIFSIPLTFTLMHFNVVFYLPSSTVISCCSGVTSCGSKKSFSGRSARKTERRKNKESGTIYI